MCKTETDIDLSKSQMINELNYTIIDRKGMLECRTVVLFYFLKITVLSRLTIL